MLSGFEITLALVLLILSVIYYLRLDKSLGFLMLLIYAIAYPFAYKIAQLNCCELCSITQLPLYLFGTIDSVINVILRMSHILVTVVKRIAVYE